MDLYAEYLSEQAASHYERTVFNEDINTAIQNTKQISFTYMEQLEGWCTRNKASVLIDLVYLLRPNTIVEIGVWGGKSLIPMAQCLKQMKKGKVYGIDPWDSLASIDGMDGVHYEWWFHVDHKLILKGLIEKIFKFKLNEQIELIKATSEEAPVIDNIDMLHIDGNHSEKASMMDVNKWVPLVRTGGIIILDDMDWPTNESAVKFLDTHCIRIAAYQENQENNIWGLWMKP
jgi:predicted O-methyltransferase YrrM